MASSTTKLTVWNMALGFIGTRTIASESEKTLEAVQCNLYWDSARRQALRAHAWNFAQRRAALASMDVPTGYEQEYAFAYALPTDLLKASKILPNGKDYELMGDREAGRFIIVYDGTSQTPILVCNADKAILSYTADIEDVSIFDDLFVNYVSRKLAALIAVSLLKNNPAKVQELEQLVQMALPTAYEADAQEGREKDIPDSWIASRGGYHAYK